MSGEIEVTLRGRLGFDAQLRVTPAGQELVQLDVAVNVTRRLEDGSFEDVRTDWVRVTVWGKRAKHVANLTKGTLVHVRGTLTPKAYLSATGEALPSVDVTARDVYLVPFTATPVADTAQPVPA